MSEDFTTARYSEILAVAKQKYQFSTFTDVHQDGCIALWRHDVDFSPHRALALARIEADAGVVANYFIQVSSRFYNVFEPEITEIIREIGRLGHEIGLHYDAEVIGNIMEFDHERQLDFQVKVLEHLAQKLVVTFSLHNPTTIKDAFFNNLQIGELINASHRRWMEDFSYCSDSNGLWRFRSLENMIADPMVSRLYALTHPEWWQSKPMLPRERLQRCIDGRKTWLENYYDALLASNNRPNLRHKEV